MDNLIVTVFNNVKCKSKDEQAITWQDIKNELDYPKVFPSKEECPLIKLATFGDVQTEKGSLKHNDNVIYLTGLEGDYDAGQVQPQQAIAWLQNAGIIAAIYTSPSHTANKPLWRVLAPFSIAHPPTSP
jgi:hypothetical protein